MDFLRFSLTNKAFPFPIFFSILLLFSSSLLVFASVSNNKAFSTPQQCIEDHFSALLQLKHGFYFSHEYNTTTLSSWNPDNRDCCSWEGITCDAATGHVIGLDLSYLRLFGRVNFGSIFRLQSLQRLNLAGNHDFDPSPFPSGFDKLTSLTHLNLSSLNFYGQIPLEISRLTTLVSLDLSYNQYDKGLDIEFLKLENPSFRELLQNLSRLTELHLDWVDIFQQGSEWGLALSSSLPHLRKLSLRECGLSGPIHSSLSKLHYLSQLHLSYNNLSSVLPNFMGNFSSLTSLHLSDCGLRGKIPESIFRLPNLQTLDVGDNPLLTGEIPPNNTLRQLSLSNTGFCSKLRDSLGNLKLLTMLELSDCKLSGPLPSWPVMLHELMYLDLSSNGFSGPISSSYANKLQNLEVLILTNNSLSGTIPSSLFSLPSLRVLRLGYNQFSGHLEEFQNASSSLLQRINLSNNKLRRPIPRSIFQLTNLTGLWLCSNNFIGTIPTLYGNELHNCKYLVLYSNSLSGTIPSSLFSLPSLVYLFLSSNQFSGQLGEFYNASSSPLERIFLENNKLQGPIPRSIFELTKLELLMLESNNFSGDVELGSFQNLTKLSDLNLSDNNFSIRGSNSTFLSFPQIIFLSLRSCNISKFPDILRYQEWMYYLDLSNNIINGEIPNWIWKVGNGSLSYLNLSHNALEGLEQPFPHLSFNPLKYLDLSFNKLKGSISIPPPSIFFSLSSNNLSGEVPSLICNYPSLQVLDLSNNHFNGSIPPCLGEVNDALTALNLGENGSHGTLLQTFKEECNLETLDLNGNRLEGQVPRSLAKCKKLEVLNLGNNQIHDVFPFGLEYLSRLRILILRSNKFHGTIGHLLTNYSFPLLQIFDLSSNNFMGSLPSNMFRSWKAMMEATKSQSQFMNRTFGSANIYYQDKVTIVSKGLEMELVKILVAFTLVDLSNNQFHGDIPESVGDLNSLHVLNMSYNRLTGQIPISLGGINDLESLDLSHNNLSGKIPLQLTKLTFLEVLDLSQNLLIGSIPQGQQFSTFTNKSFLGNSGLCGPPLSKKCEYIKDSTPLAQLDGKYDWESLWIGFGVGYGIGMGILFWTLALWTKGMREFTIFIDRMLLLIFPCEAFILRR